MAKRPPVPPANRSPKGPGSDPKIAPDDKQRADPNANQREQGVQAEVDRIDVIGNQECQPRRTGETGAAAL